MSSTCSMMSMYSLSICRLFARFSEHFVRSATCGKHGSHTVKLGNIVFYTSFSFMGMFDLDEAPILKVSLNSGFQ